MTAARAAPAVFETVSRLSDPGRIVNEDRAGAEAGLAWIIDGASGVSPIRFTPAESDAAWLAGTLDASLGAAGRDDAMAGPAALDRLLDRLDRELAADFARLGLAPADAPDHLAPSAALGLLHAEAIGDGISIEGGFLGDVVVLVPTADGVVRWSDTRLGPFEDMTFAALSRGEAATRDQILRNRQMMNRPQGYWVVHPVRPWAGSRRRFAAHVASGANIILASDGFMRLVDLFCVDSDASLYAAMLDGRAEERLAALRALEEQDGSMTRHPRPKRRDDATALVVRVVI